MLSKEEQEKIVAFLKQKLDIDSNQCYCYYNMYEEEYEEELEDLAFRCEADDWAHGCTKLVLFFKELSDWVVKIPLFGEYHEEDDSYHDFEHANQNIQIENYNDYCAVEAYLTKEAYAEELDEMFAKTFYICDINGVPIYIAEKAEGVLNKGGVEYTSQHSAYEANDLYESYYDQLQESSLYDKHYFRYFVDQYGAWETERLIQFIVDWNIDDLHLGNLGFDKNGHIKIIDYSGFHN